MQVPAQWEALWTNPHTPHFHLYVALVLLQYKRKEILQPELHYGRMHEICASLRGTVNLQVRAACVSHCAAATVHARRGRMGLQRLELCVV